MNKTKHKLSPLKSPKVNYFKRIPNGIFAEFAKIWISWVKFRFSYLECCYTLKSRATPETLMFISTQKRRVLSFVTFLVDKIVCDLWQINLKLWVSCNEILDFITPTLTSNQTCKLCLTRLWLFLFNSYSHSEADSGTLTSLTLSKFSALITKNP